MPTAPQVDPLDVQEALATVTPEQALSAETDVGKLKPPACGWPRAVDEMARLYVAVSMVKRANQPNVKPRVTPQLLGNLVSKVTVVAKRAKWYWLVPKTNSSLANIEAEAFCPPESLRIPGGINLNTHVILSEAPQRPAIAGGPMLAITAAAAEEHKATPDEANRQPAARGSGDKRLAAEQASGAPPPKAARRELAEHPSEEGPAAVKASLCDLISRVKAACKAGNMVAADQLTPWTVDFCLNMFVDHVKQAKWNDGEEPEAAVMFLQAVARRILDTPCLDDLPALLRHYDTMKTVVKKVRFLPDELALLKSIESWDYAKSTELNFGALGMHRKTEYVDGALYKQFMRRRATREIEAVLELKDTGAQFARLSALGNVVEELTKTEQDLVAFGRTWTNPKMPLHAKLLYAVKAKDQGAVWDSFAAWDSDSPFLGLQHCAMKGSPRTLGSEGMVALAAEISKSVVDVEALVEALHPVDLMSEACAMKLNGEKGSAATQENGGKLNSPVMDDAVRSAAAAVIAPIWAKVPDGDLPSRTGSVLRDRHAKATAAKAESAAPGVGLAVPEIKASEGAAGGGEAGKEPASAPAGGKGAAAEPAAGEQPAETLGKAGGGSKSSPLSIEERFPVGSIVIGKSARYKDKYDGVRGKVVSHPGVATRKVKVMLLNGSAKDTKHDYSPEHVSLESKGGLKDSLGKGAREGAVAPESQGAAEAAEATAAAQRTAADLFDDPGLLSNQD
ncbi:unnamed protein product [Prorocentrum cordatum]|uniref:Uncharacterized protein n=1 Tax=Prorocentrum cordatum TaxID=2364126 RepID=A0ABN9XIB7_9DINO|nr:unnamed protein product [Polarella glacialis]